MGEVFQRLDADAWRASGGNPAAMLRALGPEGVRAALERGDGVLAAIERVQVGLPGREAWGAELGAGVAYFSMEFAFSDHLPIYSGGLGVLAADHIKAASQLGLPVVGLGLLYRTAFARQTLDADGAQVSAFPVTDVRDLPVEPLLRDGRQARVAVPVGDEVVQVDLWRTWVGSLPVILMDTAGEDNPEHLRGITDRLYVSEPEGRLRQEIVLGIGGVRALRAANLSPTLLHLNEGHSFLAPYERLRERVAAGENPAEARAAIRKATIFTTHTPVAAGSDYFEPDLVRGLLGPFLLETGVDVDEFIGWGRLDPDDGHERLCTTLVALRGAGTAVGVSRLHGEVSRRLWRGAWPGIVGDDAKVPIGAITNGVHMPTWVAPEISGLLEEFVDPRWHALDPDDRRWQSVSLIPDQVLWQRRGRLRRRLVERARATEGNNRLFDPDSLTIGFSRRFAEYKRAGLLLRDRERLVSILGAPGREVQLVFAGKAHPADGIGRELVQEVVTFARGEPRMAFIEDYDMSIAALLTGGADVWLNTPRRLLEASGTSGMKAGANGALNLSIADGWWDEGRRSNAGWTIPSNVDLDHPVSDDDAEAEALYRLLEERVVPLFYDRDPDGIPSGWVAMVRASIRHVASNFSARRMVLDYYRGCYVPAVRRVREERADARPGAGGTAVAAGASQSTASGGRTSTAEKG